MKKMQNVQNRKTKNQMLKMNIEHCFYSEKIT